MDSTLFSYCYTRYDPECGASWIILYGNMDYTKVGSDGKCPNCTTLTYESVTSCN